jgi:glycerophosphoryl diester phosphodiesterase
MSPPGAIIRRLGLHLFHLVAHRGNAREFPENTLPAFASALECGAHALELDVQLIADGTPVVIHDSRLSRTTTGRGVVQALSADALDVVDSGEPKRFGDRFRGTRIPRLADVLALVDEQPDVTMFVEIKRESLRWFGHDRVITEVLRVIGPRRARCVLISFDREAVALARARGAAAIGWVLSRYSQRARRQAGALEPEFLFCNYKTLPPSGALWPGRWAWVIYEVTSWPLAQALAARGVAFIETMAVREMAAALRTASTD